MGRVTVPHGGWNHRGVNKAEEEEEWRRRSGILCEVPLVAAAFFISCVDDPGSLHLVEEQKVGKLFVLVKLLDSIFHRSAGFCLWHGVVIKSV